MQTLAVRPGSPAPAEPVFGAPLTRDAEVAATYFTAIESLGGKLESFYYAFGDVDVYAVFDAPDHMSATALALAVTQSGSVNLKTVVLMTPEEMDQAGKKAVDYRPPGR